MAVIVLEADVPVTRRARFVRVGQISRVERPYGGKVDATVELAGMTDGGCYAFVSADSAGETLRPGPLAIWARPDHRGVTLDASPFVVAGDWLWWERVERAP